MVHSNCRDGDWVCLGSRKVKIFAEKNVTPIYEGVTDVPILFFGQPQSVGIEGSRDIKYKLNSMQSQEYFLAYLKVIPKPKHTPGIVTDLLRVESTTGAAIGATLDLAVDRESIVPLIVNSYQLSQYITQSAQDGNRGKTAIPVQLKPGEVKEIILATHVSEKKAKSILQPQKKP